MKRSAFLLGLAALACSSAPSDSPAPASSPDSVAAACTADCAGRECGPDGCGGLCGTCPAEAPWCDEAGQCFAAEGCVPDCNGRRCGDDGCGDPCGECPSFAPICGSDFQCHADCEPDCAGKDCGADGCGGQCGQCGPGEYCNLGACEVDCVSDAACDGPASGTCTPSGSLVTCEEAAPGCLKLGLPALCPDGSVCVDGACEEVACEPWAHFCYEDAVVECDTTGTFAWLLDDCAALGVACVDGGCASGGDTTPAGACLSPQDQAALNSPAGSLDLAVCATQCSGDPVCLGACAAAALGTSKECTACVAGGLACLSVEGCAEAFEVCAGVSLPAAWGAADPCASVVCEEAANDPCCVECIPSCAGKACGDNGCGGACGTCGDGEVCTPAGQCGAAPASCAGRCGTLDQAMPCQCDESCHIFKDCCPDLCTQCADTAPGQCECPPGGDACPPPPESCDPNPCLNGGTCSVASSGGVLCECAFGYKGPTCGKTLAAAKVVTWSMNTLVVLENGELVLFKYNSEEFVDQGPYTEIAAARDFVCGQRAVDASWYCVGGGLPTDLPNKVLHAVTGGGFGLCGIDDEGHVVCFSGSYEEGFGAPPAAGGYVQVSRGWEHGCARTAGGQVDCWGKTNGGFAADPEYDDFVDVQAGGGHNCGIRKSGGLHCWAAFTTPQGAAWPIYALGSFEGMPLSKDFAAIEEGGLRLHTCARRVDGTAVCFGGTTYGWKPAPAPSATWSGLSGYATHACFITQSGHVQCWGNGEPNLPIKVPAFLAPPAGGDDGE